MLVPGQAVSCLYYIYIYIHAAYVHFITGFIKKTFLNSKCKHKDFGVLNKLIIHTHIDNSVKQVI